MPQSWPFLARPPIQSRSVSGLRYPLEGAGVAQLAEQLFCKQQVIGSIPFAGSSCGSSCALAGRDLLLVDVHEPMFKLAGALSRYSKP